MKIVLCLKYSVTCRSMDIDMYTCRLSTVTIALVVRTMIKLATFICTVHVNINLAAQ